MQTGFLLVQGRIPRVDWCEHDHESSGSIKGRVIIYKLSDKWLVKKVCRQLIQLAKHHGCFFGNLSCRRRTEGKCVPET